MDKQYAIGMGWSTRANPQDALTLLRKMHHQIGNIPIQFLALPQSKKEDPISLYLCRALKISISWITNAQIKEQQSQCQSFSQKVRQYTQFNSICEACALACFTQHRQIIIPKQVARHITCAIAQGDII